MLKATESKEGLLDEPQFCRYSNISYCPVSQQGKPVDAFLLSFFSVALVSKLQFVLYVYNRLSRPVQRLIKVPINATDVWVVTYGFAKLPHQAEKKALQNDLPVVHLQIVKTFPAPSAAPKSQFAYAPKRAPRHAYFYANLAPLSAQRYLIIPNNRTTASGTNSNVQFDRFANIVLENEVSIR